MQVANTYNNSIRILFNPRVEKFSIFDFLLVKSSEDSYLAQIIEIYDDKFDASQNVAKLKLFYKIGENNYVMPYDGFTPTKECEVIKLKPNEIEAFINQNKKTFAFAKNVKNTADLNLQYDFFANNPIIMADKIENSNAISINLAQNLASQKHVIIIDSTGILEIEKAKKLTASKNFKLPLCTETIGYLFDNCLKDGSLEFQAIGNEIATEICKYVKKQELEFLPFSSFVRVLLDQYEATPYTELKLFLSRLKRFQVGEIFAKTKKDIQVLQNAVTRNKITIIDFSSLDSFWSKIFFEFIVRYIKQDVFLISRVNEETVNADIIDDIYNKYQNINFVPCVSYNYKKLPSIIKYSQNYILMPSLSSRIDFANANFGLASLLQDGCIVFGKNTDDFLFIASDYEIADNRKEKNYRKIALSMVAQDETLPISENEHDDFDTCDTNKKLSDSEILMKELANLRDDNVQEIEQDPEKIEPEQFDEIKDFIPENNEETEINNKEELDINTEIEEKSEDIIEEVVEAVNTTEVQEDVLQEENDILENKIEEDLSFKEIAEETKEEVAELEENVEKSIEEVVEDKVETNDEMNIEEDTELSTDNLEEIFLSDDKSDTPQIYDEETQISSVVLDIEETNDDSDKPHNYEETDEVKVSEIPNIDIDIEHSKETIEINDIENTEINTDILTEEKTLDILDNPQVLETTEEISLSDEELDFFQIARESSAEYENNTLTENQPSQSSTIEMDTVEDDIDLEAVANNSIEKNFQDVIESRNTEEEDKQTFNIDKDVKIDVSTLKKPPENAQNLPIYKENLPQDNKIKYQINDVIVHKKYGKGRVVKTVKYEERQLLQIEFETSGKKLLDPKIADIQLEK